MIDVLLVDDEPWVLEGLRTLVRWEEHGFRVCGEASNGKAALAMMEELAPGLVLTDIHMPAVNGLELIEAAMAKLPRPPHFVILSGYDSFEYAARAIKHRVRDYLLKPIDEEEVSALLKQLRAKMEQDGERKAEGRRSRFLYANRLINRLIRGETGEELEDQALEVLNAEGDEELRLLLVDAGVPASESMNMLEEVFQDAGGQLFSDSDGRPGLIVCGDSPGLTVLEEKVRKLCERLADASPYPPIAGFSESLKGAGAIGELYLQAAEAVKGKRCQGTGGIAYFCRYRKAPANPEINKSAVDDLIRAAIQQAEIDIPPLLKEALIRPGASVPEPAYMRLQVRALELTLCRSIHDRQGDADAFMEGMRESFGGSEEEVHDARLKDYAQALCQRAIHLFGELEQREGQDVAYRLVRQVDEEFRGKLTLRDLALTYHMNAVYLGQLFKQHTGKSFRDYINDKRIEEAKRLLIQNRLSVAEIAQSVGYPNTDYFISTFKRKTGSAPLAFKRQPHG